MAKLLIITIFACLSSGALALPLESPYDENGSHFTGRLSRVNKDARLVRVRTEFPNIKFLNRKDRLEFWDESFPRSRCQAVVEGRTNDYLLIKIPDYDRCIRSMNFTTGSYLHFDSKDLKQTLVIARELVEILLKKRLAMRAKKERHERDLATYVDRVDVVNKRYEVLRQKLEIEWQKELAAMEEDKSVTFAEYKNAEARLNEIDTKLEAYRVEDNNLKLDRWSLDPALYIRK